MAEVPSEIARARARAPIAHTTHSRACLRLCLHPKAVINRRSGCYSKVLAGLKGLEGGSPRGSQACLDNGACFV